MPLLFIFLTAPSPHHHSPMAVGLGEPLCVQVSGPRLLAAMALTDVGVVEMAGLAERTQSLFWAPVLSGG